MLYHAVESHKNLFLLQALQQLKTTSGNSLMLALLSPVASLKQKQEATSYQKSLQGILEGKGKWWREQGRKQVLDDGVR